MTYSRLAPATRLVSGSSFLDFFRDLRLVDLWYSSSPEPRRESLLGLAVETRFRTAPRADDEPIPTASSSCLVLPISASNMALLEAWRRSSRRRPSSLASLAGRRQSRCSEFARRASPEPGLVSSASPSALPGHLVNGILCLRRVVLCSGGRAGSACKLQTKREGKGDRL